MATFKLNGSRVSWTGIFLAFSLLIFCVLGWVFNIYHLASSGALVFDGETVIRIIGIFVAPIGVIMGWFF